MAPDPGLIPGEPEPSAPDAPGRVSPSPVAPGSGWPGDPASPSTPVAASPADAARLAASAGTLAELTARESVCRACPRLVAWREQICAERRKSFQSERYWGRPIPGWGDDDPRILIVGLAPAAHGGNRTGRIFTGDRSGDFLFAALYRCGLAASPISVAADDGQRLLGVRIVAAVRCAPPDNKPTPGERSACEPWLATELAMVTQSLRAIVCLGGFGWQALWPALVKAGFTVPKPRPAFGHGVEVSLTHTGAPGTPSTASSSPVLLLGCYHPSQQNTFTGRVTPAMLDAVLTSAVSYSGRD
ncbi:MAG TPA: uracil-DNA glycosylase [Streptosporangiaceae bacterium]|nr:uracil-DNA glycosylase [Streptosporangiaceae bacterium]